MTCAITGWRAKRYPENASLHPAQCWRGRARPRGAVGQRPRRPCDAAGRSLSDQVSAMTPAPTMVNAFDPARSEALPEGEAALVARRQRLLGPAYRLFYDHPVHLVRGEGVWLYDPAGNAYLDVYNNVPVVGHCHPRVVAAMAGRPPRFNTHTRYLHECILDYAEALLATRAGRARPRDVHLHGQRGQRPRGAGGQGQHRRDRLHRHRQRLPWRDRHGRRPVARRSGRRSRRRRTSSPLPAPDPRRDRRWRRGGAFASGVEAALDAWRTRGMRPAALIVDTIFSSDGVFADPPGFLRPARRAHPRRRRPVHRRRGAGRVRPHRRRACGASAATGVVPDLVTMGKPMGNGHPVAAMLARPALLEASAPRSRYFNTFGGNPVSIAAAQAVLDVIADENLVEQRARRPARYLREACPPAPTRTRGSARFAAAACSSGSTSMPARAARSGAARGRADRQRPARAARADQRLRAGRRRAEDPAAAALRPGRGGPVSRRLRRRHANPVRTPCPTLSCRACTP